MFPPLQLPKAQLRLARRGKGIHVWCVLRKKFLLLTPEEWVRQHLIHFLMHHKGYPQGRMASEYAISYNGMSKRCDIVVFNAEGKPKMIFECKAPEVQLTQKTVFQIAQYNKVLQVERLIISNGNQHFNFELSEDISSLIMQNGIPSWTEN
jgi:hypothetical protein